ncbi:MAG: hypothetical protein HYX20_01800 [Candidatus Yanofskybacteria bacterium]|nr:hypothetical protein [Candidatus Yanofskybacteria bacterium]
MRKDKERAFELRRSGKSYKQISRELEIPISTLAGWFKDEPWSIEIRDRLASTESLAYPEKLKRLIAIVKHKYAILHESYRKEARDEFPALKNAGLFIAGLMLYWGEGDKKVENSIVRLNNSELGMIRVFYLFLTKAMDIPSEKIRFNLLLYPDLADMPLKRLWSNATGIPLSQFRKSVYIQGRHPTRRLSYGVGNIRVGGRKYKEKLLEWIKLYEKELCN